MGERTGLYSVGVYGRGELAGLDLDVLVAKAGGRFRLVTLIQRRMRDLQRGAPPLVERISGNLMQAAVEEYYRDKIWLVGGEEAEKLREDRASLSADKRGPPAKEASASGRTRAGPPESGASK